jgi:hypothetical protein
MFYKNNVIFTNLFNALEHTDAMIKHRTQAIEAINQATQNQGIPLSQFQVRNQVWLDNKHLKLPYQSSKLAPKWYGPFIIMEEISPVAYCLTLPASWMIHDVFHASLLSPF